MGAAVHALLIDAARPCRHVLGDRWFTDETYIKQLRCTQVTSAGHAFIQNLRRGHDELGAEEIVNLRVPAAFDELTLAI